MFLVGEEGVLFVIDLLDLRVSRGCEHQVVYVRDDGFAGVARVAGELLPVGMAEEVLPVLIHGCEVFVRQHVGEAGEVGADEVVGIEDAACA